MRLMARHQLCMPFPPLARRRRGSEVQGEGRAGVCAEQTRICNICELVRNVELIMRRTD